ncbi:MAG: leucine-rich repeat domain-containing protein [Oscillospiraceae bacterium]|nr:leucine-rich repeat domain-containing protein [Oscillospiraceae bacterium]
MKKTKWTDEEVYELLRRIDEGYTPDADEAAMLAARMVLDLSDTRITALPASLGQLTGLHWLDLSHTQITALPESLGQLTGLQTLILSSTPITALPASLGQLTRLQSLNLHGTKITALPESIGLLTSLEGLFLSNTQITALPESIGQLTSLVGLYTWETQITALPESLGQLTALQTLDLSGAPITALPESLGQLKSLKTLNLRRTRITALPESLGQLTGLQYLNLSGAPITALPASLGQLTALQNLDLSGAPITALPESLGQLTGLQTLILSSTPITALPASLGQLTGLQSLNLSDTQITALPESLGQLTGLQTLDLGDTRITSLPEFLSQLMSLRKLRLRGIKITTLPGFIGRLTNLDTLDLEGTEIMNLPEWIGKLPALRMLDLAGLKLPEFPRSLALRGLPFVDKENFYFTDTGVNLHGVTLTKQDISVFLNTPELIPSLYEDQVPLRQCRVLFLGDGGSGKTYTIRRIRNGCKKESAENAYHTVQTPGVEIADYHVDRGADSFDVHFWDFGGQELQHSMHRCFLTDKTSYVVTVRTRETDVTPRARYWLQNVMAFAKNSPILLYVNCWENYDGRKAVDEAMLREEFPNIRNVVYVSAKEAGEEAFRTELVEEIADMAADSYGCRQTVNYRWLAVQKDILTESKTSHYLTKTRYAELCRKHGIPENQDADLLELFNILGVCFSYHWDEDRNELEDYKLLNPVWLTNAIYTIIVRGEVHAREGEITVASIRELLNRQEAEQNGSPMQPKRRYRTEECQYVVDVAAAHNLCYRVNANSLFFPALCSNNTPVQELSNSGDYAQHVEYALQYKYLPDSVVHQLMVRCRKADIVVNHCWLKGMVLGSMDAHKAIIRMEDDKNLHIEIWSRAEHPAYEFFELLRRELLAVNERLNLKAQEFIVDGEDRYSIIMLYRAAKGTNVVYGPATGAERIASELLGQFYEDWTVKLMQVDANGVIMIPILPRIYHPCKKKDPVFRTALYEAYNRVCPYCRQPIHNVEEMEVDHILPQDQKELEKLPELSLYLRYLEARGFSAAAPDYIENFFPAHGECNRKKLNHVDIYALLARHEAAAAKTPKVLRLMEKYGKAGK